ncbi:MAG: hypothetical protein K2X38_04415 [Gemmataceae bacterium]|nr:hypothetical protein [Gemmataceae bacterium]
MATAPTTLSTRIRHPLQAVRGYIRSYVLQEGIALGIIYLAAAFWLGLILDYGLFLLFHYDWILELNFMDEAGQASLAVRIVLLLLAASGLAMMLHRKVVRRMFTEFSDQAVALVLERRFPRDLGDRLITAVELANPDMGPKLGYSSAFISQTISDAHERVSRLPVSRVFDWVRLRWLWTYAVLMTAGVFLVVSAVSIAFSMWFGWIDSPGDHFGKFFQTSTIWSERNLLLQNSYWHRNSLIELVRFQDSENHPGEMRIGRDEARPDVTVRAVKWAVADRSVVGGWRSLKVSELSNYLPAETLAGLKTPSNSKAWVIDLDELDRSIPNGVLPAGWHGKTSGEIREAIAKDERIRQEITQAKANAAVESMLDWKQWTVDRLELQMDDVRVLQELSEKEAAEFRLVLEQLADVTSQTSMSRSIRKLEIPKEVHSVFRGEQTKSETTTKMSSDNKFILPLKDLTESSTFHVRGNDAFTPTRSIVLAPPPVVVKMFADKEEPAYIYYRVQGNQVALKGKRQIFKDFEVSVTGDLTTIDVPFGASLVITGKVDRKIKETMLVKLDTTGMKDAQTGAPGVFVRDADGKGFRAEFPRVEKHLPLIVNFFDEDNVRGERRIRIRPIDDQPPEVLVFEPSAELRKPKFQDPNKAIGIPSDGLLITPDAVIPFNGVIRDDIGLTRGDWAIELEQAEFELASKSSIGKKETKEPVANVPMVGNSRTRRAVVASGLLRISPTLPYGAAVESAWTARLLELEAKRGGLEETTPILGVAQRLQGVTEMPINQIEEMLVGKAPKEKPHLKEYNFHGDEVFDLRKHLPKLKARDATREAQLHYILKLSILAADNNVETGPGIGRSKTPVTFLIVTENELLAQIAMEEELLREKLEKQHQKMKTALITLDDQIVKLSTSGDPSLVLIRIDEIRKAVLDATSGTREVHQGSAKILRELEINRARVEKQSEMRNKIVLPLEELVNPTIGHFADVDGSVQKLYEKLDEDVNAKRTESTRDQHGTMARTTKKQMEELLQAMDRILAAMEEGIVFSKLLEIAIQQERDQRDAAKLLAEERRVQEEILLQDLFGPKKK